MQLNKNRSIKAALAAASSSVLGLANAAGWQVDSAVLLYAEVDRVSAFEPVINARKELADDEFIDIRLVLDSLTGSSANGAVPRDDIVQTFTTPSGEGSYQVERGETPLDPSFRDTRGALSINWERPLNSRLKSIYGINISKEFDYRSLGLSASLVKDINERNTSLSAAFSIGQDLASPIGGIPVANSDVPTRVGQAKQVTGQDDSKTLYGLMLGVTQVFSRQTLAQLNFSYAQSNGYLTDPYKIVSVVGASGYPLKHVFESRPDQRSSQSLYAKVVHQLSSDVINLSYRYFWDNWGIVSHTLDFHYRYEINSRYYLRPHVRYYQQSAADFYRYFIRDQESPAQLSADYRLGGMTTTTIGIMLGSVRSQTSELSMRIEMITQSGESHPAEAIGQLRQQDLFPDVKAYVIQVGYSLVF